MPLDVPVLDDRSFDQLVAEGRSLIPRYSPQWTNHNPADPGIALLELLAWLTEAAMFQSDQVAPEAVERFLDLLGMPRGEAALDDAVADALRALRANPRAVTAPDHVALAERVGGARVARAEYVAVEEPLMRYRTGHRVLWARPIREGTRIGTLGGVDAGGRAWAATVDAVIAAIDAAGENPDERDQYYVERPTEDRVRLIVAERQGRRYVKTVADGDEPNNLLALPHAPLASYAGEVPDARERRSDILPGHGEPPHPGEPATVGMLVVVPSPAVAAGAQERALLDEIFAELQRLRLLTARVHVVPPGWVRVKITTTVARRPGTGLAAQAVRERLLRFLDRVEGGEQGTGWPFGRDVHASELYQVLEEAPEIDHVVSLELAAIDPPDRGERDRVRLEATELVLAERDDIDVTVVES